MGLVFMLSPWLKSISVKVLITILTTGALRLAHWMPFLKASFGLLDLLHLSSPLFPGLVLISARRGDTNPTFAFVTSVMSCGQ